MRIIQNPLPDRKKQYVFNKAVKTKGYLELCEKNLMSANDKISFESPEHHIIKSILKDIRSAVSEVEVLIARTKQ